MKPTLDPRVEHELRHLPTERVSDPDALWNAIQDELHAPHERRRGPLLRRPVRSPLLVAAAAVLAVVSGAAVAAVRMYAPPARWAVVPLTGAPVVGGRTLSDSGTLAEGEWLETDDRSRATLALGRIGTAHVGPDSRVRLERTGLTEQRLTLERGSFHAAVSAPPRIFVVDTPVARATDLGCAYTLDVDSTGVSRLRVIAGSVELRHGDATTIVPMGLVAEVGVGGRIGTPYAKELAPAARDALHRMDADSARPADLDLVLGAMYGPDDHPTFRRRSAITLWHLVERVPPARRAEVYDHLTALVPEPVGVTREGMLALDRQMEERWREALHPSWSDEGRTWVTRLGRRLWEWAVR